MRPDQVERLRTLSEALADRFIKDADPANWSGGDLLTRDMTQQDRGDAYWCRKAAMATGGVLRYVLDLTERKDSGETPADAALKEADLDRSIREAERRAAAAVERVLKKAKAKDAVVSRAHGAKR